MVTVDPRLCCYCGGCVSLCPVDALDLAETRLVVSEECIDCGTCLAACPVGALSPGPAPRGATLASRSDFSSASVAPRYDLVVAGAGPAGSAAALEPYQQQVECLLGQRLARDYRLRQRFPAGKRADRSFVRLFAVAAAGK